MRAVQQRTGSEPGVGLGDDADELGNGLTADPGSSRDVVATADLEAESQ
jgi:hypothetical protein